MIYLREGKPILEVYLLGDRIVIGDAREEIELTPELAKQLLQWLQNWNSGVVSDEDIVHES